MERPQAYFHLGSDFNVRFPSFGHVRSLAAMKWGMLLRANGITTLRTTSSTTSRYNGPEEIFGRRWVQFRLLVRSELGAARATIRYLISAITQ